VYSSNLFSTPPPTPTTKSMLRSIVSIKICTSQYDGSHSPEMDWSRDILCMHLDNAKVVCRNNTYLVCITRSSQPLHPHEKYLNPLSIGSLLSLKQFSPAVKRAIFTDSKLNQKYNSDTNQSPVSNIPT